MIAGIVLLVTRTQSGDTLSFRVELYIAIAVGAAVMLLGFLGCTGALCESQCLLATVSRKLGGNIERLK